MEVKESPTGYCRTPDVVVVAVLRKLPIVTLGVGVPDAVSCVAVYSTTESVWLSVTHRSPAASKARFSGPLRDAVESELMTTLGVGVPEAVSCVGVYMARKLLPQLAIHTSPAPLMATPAAPVPPIVTAGGVMHRWPPAPRGTQ